MSSADAKRRRTVAMAFKSGAISRVKLKDFVTYSEVEFRPGPGLNVVIGPNGTGKSTIVSAICLGLAGSPRVLGRQSNPKEFIRNGKEEAHIEIELARGEGQEPLVVQRIISSSGSRWAINGSRKKEDQVRKLVSKLEIQVDNLCQFLPQDKVPEFARMDEKELLRATQKATGGQTMVDQHEKLCTLSKQLATMREKTEICENHLEKLEQQNERIRPAIELHAQRQQQVKTVAILKKKLPWVVYEEHRREYQQAKESRDAAKKELKALEEQNKPLTAERDQARAEKEAIDKKLQTHKMKLLTAKKNVNTANATAQDALERMDGLETEISQKEASIRACQSKAADLEREIEETQRQIDDLEDVSSLKAKETELKNERAALQDKLVEMRNRNQELRDEFQRCQKQHQSSQVALKRLEDARHQKQTALKKSDDASYMALQWLEEPENRKLFKKTIHPPPMVSMDVVDRKFARYVEAAVAFRDLLCFVAEDEEDQRLFISKVCEDPTGPRLKVNVALAPRHVDTRHVIPLDSLRPFGLTNFLVDVVRGPQAVVNFVCHQAHLHMIAVGTEQVDSHIEDIKSKYGRELWSFMSPSSMYSLFKAKYGSDGVIIKEGPIGHPKSLQLSVDKGEQEQLKSRVRDLNTRIQELAERSKDTQAQQETLGRQCDAIEGKIKEVQKKTKLEPSLRKQLTSQQARRDKQGSFIKKYKGELEGLKREQASAFSTVLDRQHDVVKAFKTMDQLTHAMSKLLLSGLQAEQALRKAQAELDLRSEEYVAAKKAYDQLAARCSELKQQAVADLEAAKLATDGDLTPELRQAFKPFPSDAAEIRSQIDSMEAQLACTDEVDQHVIDEYNRRCVEIEEDKKNLEELVAQVRDAEQDIAATEATWLDDLQSKVERINAAFSASFDSMGCAGQVGLAKHPTDYSLWGIEVKVKFRPEEELQRLSGQRQSGGERSVSTMLYLMAMQSLTMCPFRVVDEINQGMDAANERRVFEQVVRCCEESGSQYFLVTPKLLPDLPYGKHTRVLCVYNGHYMPNYTEWNTPHFVRRQLDLTRGTSR